MNKNKVDMDVLALAAVVGGEMNKIEKSVTHKGSSVAGQAKKININDFVSNVPKSNVQTTNTKIARGAMIQPPKSTPAGRDVVAIVPADNLNFIPIPDDMKDIVAELEKRNPPEVPTVVKENSAQKINVTYSSDNKTQLDRIEQKLDNLMEKLNLFESHE